MQTKKFTFLFRCFLGMALLAITFLATVKLDMPVVVDLNDKASHLLAFFVLALLLDFSFPLTGFQASKFISLFGYGLAVEIIQYYLPHRTFSLLDLAADTVGLFLYGGMVPLLKKVSVLKSRWEQG